MINIDNLVEQALDKIRTEGHYRVFIELERACGRFPKAKMYSNGSEKDVTIWCSNDYLGMGQHPSVLTAMHEALDRRYKKHFRNNPCPYFIRK